MPGDQAQTNAPPPLADPAAVRADLDRRYPLLAGRAKQFEIAAAAIKLPMPAQEDREKLADFSKQCRLFVIELTAASGKEADPFAGTANAVTAFFAAFLDKVSKAMEAADAALARVVEPGEPLRTPFGTVVSAVPTTGYDIDDESKVPKSLWSPDPKKIKAEIKRRQDAKINKPIPGVRLDPGVSIRVR